MQTAMALAVISSKAARSLFSIGASQIPPVELVADTALQQDAIFAHMSEPD
jgi:hypothetical protein